MWSEWLEERPQCPMLYRLVCCIPPWPPWRRLALSLCPQHHSALPGLGHSPAAVLSLPTGVLEQLRSMVEDSEDAAPGLQPVQSMPSSVSASIRLGGPWKKGEGP